MLLPLIFLYSVGASSLSKKLIDENYLMNGQTILPSGAIKICPQLFSSIQLDKSVASGSCGRSTVLKAPFDGGEVTFDSDPSFYKLDVKHWTESSEKLLAMVYMKQGYTLNKGYKITIPPGNKMLSKETIDRSFDVVAQLNNHANFVPEAEALLERWIVSNYTDVGAINTFFSVYGLFYPSKFTLGAYSRVVVLDNNNVVRYVLGKMDNYMNKIDSMVVVERNIMKPMWQVVQQCKDSFLHENASYSGEALERSWIEYVVGENINSSSTKEAIEYVEQRLRQQKIAEYIQTYGSQIWKRIVDLAPGAENVDVHVKKIVEDAVGYYSDWYGIGGVSAFKVDNYVSNMPKTNRTAVVAMKKSNPLVEPNDSQARYQPNLLLILGIICISVYCNSR